MSKRRIVWVVWPLAVAGVLAGCGEQQQTISQGVKTDSAAFAGTGKPFVAGGWKQGDKGSWEQQMKVRTQMGQNDYNKVP